jgi:hypothetical protein
MPDLKNSNVIAVSQDLRSRSCQLPATIHVHAASYQVRFRLVGAIYLAISGNGGSTCNTPWDGLSLWSLRCFSNQTTVSGRAAAFHRADERASSPTRHVRLPAGDWWYGAVSEISSQGLIAPGRHW